MVQFWSFLLSRPCCSKRFKRVLHEGLCQASCLLPPSLSTVPFLSSLSHPFTTRSAPCRRRAVLDAVSRQAAQAKRWRPSIMHSGSPFAAVPGRPACPSRENHCATVWLEIPRAARANHSTPSISIDTPMPSKPRHLQSTWTSPLCSIKRPGVLASASPGPQSP